MKAHEYARARTRAQARRPFVDPPQLHLAAIAFVYPLLNGRLTYGECTAALFRAALRDGIVGELDDVEFQGLCERLETTLNRAAADVARDAAQAVRDGLRVPLERLAEPVILESAAHVANAIHGGLLPLKCVDWILKQEVARHVRKALGMPDGEEDT